MGAALSIFVLLSASVFIIRVASVALRITGLADDSARFQALSAFTGTGFTTHEAEAVVNYPIRRRIVGILMIIGNMGLVSVLATLVASLVHTDGETDAVVSQLAWIVGGLGLLWFLMLSKAADRLLCALIAKVLESTTFLGRREFQRMLQVGDGYSLCEHPAFDHWSQQDGMLTEPGLRELGLEVVAARSPDGELIVGRMAREQLRISHSLLLFGSDQGHEALSHITRQE